MFREIYFIWGIPVYELYAVVLGVSQSAIAEIREEVGRTIETDVAVTSGEAMFVSLGVLNLLHFERYNLS